MRPKFSIIIPAYNCTKTLPRLLDSIVAQEVKSMEVIIADDQSTEDLTLVINNYKDKLDIIYCKTTREIHCPGNTRQVGLEKARGEWITFIDNDDLFELDTFNTIEKYIEDCGEDMVVCTNFREWDIEKEEVLKEFRFDGADTWLHGKFFNLDNLIKKYNINFKEDLYSHEDGYFNSCVLATLIALGRDYNYFPIFTYKWVCNPESLSRSYFSQKHFYIETYLNDYLVGTTEPFFNKVLEMPENENYKSFAFNQTVMTLLHGYFYYQSFVYRLGDEIIPENLGHLHTLKRRIKEVFQCSDFDIINHVYKFPDKYMKVKIDSASGSSPCVELTSFHDFILKI